MGEFQTKFSEEPRGAVGSVTDFHAGVPSWIPHVGLEFLTSKNLAFLFKVVTNNLRC